MQPVIGEEAYTAKFAALAISLPNHENYREDVEIIVLISDDEDVDKENYKPVDKHQLAPRVLVQQYIRQEKEADNDIDDDEEHDTASRSCAFLSPTPAPADGRIPSDNITESTKDGIDITNMSGAAAAPLLPDKDSLNDTSDDETSDVLVLQVQMKSPSSQFFGVSQLTNASSTLETLDETHHG